MKTQYDYDVAVIGGGPAGSTVANIVAARGHKVLILEREFFPRYQIGESLIPATVHGVSHVLGVYDEIQNAGFVKKSGASFRWGNSPNIWTMRFTHSSWLQHNGANYAYQVERAKFDEILLNKARERGAEIMHGVQVQSVERESGRFSKIVALDRDNIQMTITAKYIVDAGGHNSTSYQHLGERIKSEFFKNFAVFGYFENSALRPDPYQGNIICEAFSDGWMWFIPLRTSSPTLVSVGAVLGEKHRDKMKDGPDELYRWAIGQTQYIKELLANADRSKQDLYSRLRVRKDWSYTTSQFYKDGLAVVGDAACFLDPILSTGVHFATYGGLQLGRSINTALINPTREVDYFNEFEARYKLEYQIFYKYLLAFYDMHKNEDSYYWNARKILNTQEPDSESFARLLGGSLSDPSLFVSKLEGLGNQLQNFADQLEVADMTEKSNAITNELAFDILKYGHSQQSMQTYLDSLSSREDLVQTGGRPSEMDASFSKVPQSKGFPISKDGLAWGKHE